MLFHIIEKELKDCIYSYRSILIFILSAGLFSIAIVTGGREYQAELEEYRLAQSTLRQHLASETNLYALSNFGFNLVKPPAVLGILVSGVEPHAPRVYNLALYTLPQAQGSSASENPVVAVFGTLDFAFVVQVILGLAALLFTFSSVCGEKEMGTLKLQLASALPKDTLLLGKFVGNLTGLLVPVALAFLMSFLLLLGFDAVSFAPDDAYRVLLLGLGFALYIAGLFALGMCISTFTTRTTTAFALSLVAWVLVVAILPKFAVLAARRLAPAESLQDFEMKKAAVHSQGTVEAQKMWDEYLQLHGKQMPPRAVYEEMAAQIRDRQNRELRMLDEEYMLRKERQSRLALVLARLSPAGSASYAAMSLARTGLERDLRFRSALRDYRSTFTRYYDEKSRELVQLTDAQQFPSLDVKQSFADLPAFEFHEEPLGISVERALPDLGLLVAWALVLFAAAYVKFLRYDVR